MVRSKVTTGIALGTLLVVGTAGGIYGFLELSGFFGGTRSTDTASSRFATAAERVEFLGKYVKLYSPVEDTAFHVVYHDNGFAPSDWDIRAAVRVAPAAVSAWLASAARHEGPAGFDYAKIVPADWRLESTPAFHRRNGTSLVVFEAERVIVMRISTM